MLETEKPGNWIRLIGKLNEVEGLSTPDEIKARADLFFEGKGDWDFSVAGPNKDYLFMELGGPSRKPIPFSKIIVSRTNNDGYSFCGQQGAYLGSMVLGVDKHLVSIFGMQVPDTNKPVLVSWTWQFLEKPDFLGIDYEMYIRITTERHPAWTGITLNKVGKFELMELLEGTTGCPAQLGYLCKITPEGIRGLWKSGIITRQKSLE